MHRLHVELHLLPGPLRDDSVARARFEVGEITRTDVAQAEASQAQSEADLANAQARTVAHNLTHPQDLRATDQRYVPHAVFSDPQIAAVGLTEEQARRLAEREGFAITVKVQDYGDVAYGWAMEDSAGLVKLIARKDTGQLLGAHLIGTEASILIQPLVQAMSFGLDAHTMARGQYWIHPALSEVVENALLGLDVPGTPGLPD